MMTSTYKPDGSGHCARCSFDVKSGHISLHEDDPGRELACKVVSSSEDDSKCADWWAGYSAALKEIRALMSKEGDQT